MNWLTAALDNAKIVVDWCWNFIVGNDYLQMILIISLIPLGFYIFHAGAVAAGRGDNSKRE